MKKLLAVLIAVVIAFGVIPMTTFASEYKVEGISGEMTTPLYEGADAIPTIDIDEETFEESEEYLYYYWYDYVEYTITYNGGQTYTGDWYSIIDEFDLEILEEDDQSYDNQWTVGNYTAKAYLQDVECEIAIEIVENPVASVEAVMTKELVKDVDGEIFDTSEYDPDTELEPFFLYTWENYIEITVTYKNGESFKGSISEVEEELNHMVYVDDDQLFEPWGVGTYTGTVEFMGYVTVVEITVVEEEKEPVFADVNGDGKVGAVDARLILQHVAGIGEHPEDVTAYDVNLDGKITGVDARIVLQVVAGAYLGLDLDTKEEQLAYFVNSFNVVKENAASATYVGSKVYNYNNYIYINPVIEAMEPSIRDELTSSFSDELDTSNSVTIYGEDIASSFPPAGGTCGLTMSDVSNISFTEDGDYYIVEISVKGKKNPARYESAGNVASIATKEDFEAEMTEEDLEMMSIDCDYQTAVAKAKIEKSTGNMVAYNVDYPMLMAMNVTGMGKVTEVGMGLYEEWTVAY